MARNPDTLILSYSQPSEQEAKLALACEDFPGIGAVVYDRIILAEEGATCPGRTRQVAVLHTIASGLHPEAFEDDATPGTT